MRMKSRQKIKVGIVAACFALLLLLLGNEEKKLSYFGQTVLTVGAFSDSYWEVQNGYAYRILDDAIAKFEKEHSGVRVVYESGITKADYAEWLAEKLMTDDAPDVFFVPEDDFNDLAGIGALAELSAWIQRDAAFDAGAFYDAAYSSGKIGTRIYALPFECAPKLMFVNRTILKEEQIAMPAADWNWNDFYDICASVTRDTDGDGAADRFGQSDYTWKDAFDSNGVQLFDAKGQTCFFVDDGVEDALLFMEKLQALTAQGGGGIRKL